MVRRAIFLLISLAGSSFADTGIISTIKLLDASGSPSCVAGQINVSTGSLTCSGLTASLVNAPGSSCGDSTHGLGWSGSQYTCQSITGSGGGGSSFSMVVTTGGPVSYIGTPISSFSTTTTILFDSATTKGSLLPSNTYFFTMNSASVTLQGNTNVALLNSTQTFTAQQTFNDNVNISSAILLSGNGGTVGQLITNNGPGLTPSWQAPSNPLPGFLQENHWSLQFGVSASSYITPGNNIIQSTDVENTAQLPYHSSGTLRGLWVQISANGLTSPTTIYLRINGTTRNESVVIGSASIGEFQDTKNIDIVNMGDKVDYLIMASTNATGTNLNMLGISTLFQPVNGGFMKMVSGGAPLVSGTNGVSTFYNQPVGQWFFTQQQESSATYKMKTAGYFSNYAVYVATNSRPGTTVIHFRKNNANGNGVLSIPGGASGLFEDLVDQDYVVVGDTVDYQLVMDGNGGNTNPFTVSWVSTEFNTIGNSMEYAAMSLNHSANPGDNNFWPVQGFMGTDSAEINDIQTKSQVNLNCSNLHVYVDTNSMSNPIIFTFRKNQTNQKQTLTIPAGSWGYYEDTYSSHTDTVSPGDEIDWKETVAAGGSGSAPFHYIGMTCQLYSEGNLSGGQDKQIMFNDNGNLNGSSLFTFNKASGTVNVTYQIIAGSFTSTASSSVFTNGAFANDNDSLGVLDVFKQNASAGDVIFSAGSANTANQFQIKDQTALNLAFGDTPGGLLIGTSGHAAEIYSIQAGAGAQEINYWNGGEMDLKTASSGSGGKDVVVQPQGTESIRFSNPNGVTVTSSMTINNSVVINSSLTVVTGTGGHYETTFSTSSVIFHVAVSTAGHILTNGKTPTISSCGSTPNGSVVGNDNAGTITIGGGVVTACTLTFASTWGVAPICTISDNSTAVTTDISTLNATTMTVSSSASIGGGLVYYRCLCSGPSCL